MMVTERMIQGLNKEEIGMLQGKVCFEKIFFFFFLECLHKALPDVSLLSLVYCITCY